MASQLQRNRKALKAAQHQVLIHCTNVIKSLVNWGGGVVQSRAKMYVVSHTSMYMYILYVTRNVG